MSPKPYDRLFKELAEEDLPAFLWLFAGLTPIPGEEIKPLPRDLHLPAWVLDHAYELRREGECSVWLLEAKARWEVGAALQLAKYAIALALHYGFETPIHPVLVLFAQDRSRTAREPAPEFSRKLGAVGIDVEFQCVRLWEVDAASVLKAQRPSLLPWVPLLKGGREELEQATERIVALGNQRLASALCTLGGLRYDRLTIEKLLENMPMFIPQEIIDEGPLYIEARARGKAEGKAEGEIEGRIESARNLLQHLVKKKFPELTHEAAALDKVRDPERLTAMFDEVLSAQTVEQARTALLNR